MNGFAKALSAVSLICSPLLTAAFTQTQPKGTIAGRVFDAGTGEPLMLVNVFIPNTMLGSSTNQDGYFLIENIPYGIHELVVSMMGYYVQTLKIDLPESDGRVLDFRLEPKILEAPEITVEATDATEWRRDLEKFRRAFLGESGNASKCEILNPEVLDFSNDEKTSAFTATASDPLEIVNHGLGYRIHGVLVSFSLEKDLCKYELKARFEELEPKDESERKEWMKNRLSAFNGSFRHFLTALLDSRLKEQGFFLWSTPDPYSYRLESLDDGDSQEKLFSPGDSPSTIRLHFNDFLRVKYILEPDRFLERSYQISFVRLVRDTVTVSRFGQGRDTDAVIRYGRWTYDRIAEQLPAEYRSPMY